MQAASLNSIIRRAFNRPAVISTSTRDGMTFLHDGFRELAIVDASRSWMYSRGIDRRIRKLAESYSIGTSVRLSPGDLVVNVGANIGEVAIACAQIGCRVIAIDPDPIAYACLRRNTIEWSGVTTLQHGLWDKDGSLTFYQKANTADTSAINEVGEPVEIPVRRLDSMGLEGPIKLLVGDAEGGEPEVLAGALATLRRTRFVSLDCGRERNGSDTVNACSEILRSCGFEIISEPESHRLVARARS